jgi:hypothetical protein
VLSVEEASSRRQIERFVFEAAPRPSTIALPSTARGRFRAAPRPAVLRTVRVCVVAVLRRLCCMLDRSLVPHATHMSLISEAASSGGHRSYGAALKSPGAPNPALNVQRVARPLPPSDPSVLPIWCCNAISSTAPPRPSALVAGRHELRGRGVERGGARGRLAPGAAQDHRGGLGPPATQHQGVLPACARRRKARLRGTPCTPRLLRVVLAVSQPPRADLARG